MPRMFESWEDAERYRQSTLAAETRIIEVDKNGAAL
jgi:hypothetical protein